MTYKTVKSLILVLLLGCINMHHVYAQSDTITLSLTEFIEKVKQNNLEIKVVADQGRLASLVEKDAKAAMLPQVNAQAGYKRFFNNQFAFFELPDYENIDPITGEIPQVMQKSKVGFNNDFEGHLILEQSLFSLKNIYDLQAAKQYSGIGKLEEKEKTIRIVAEAKKMFLQTALVQKVLELRVFSEAFAKENYESNKEKFEKGLVSELDLLQAQLLWEEEIPKLHNSKRNHEILLQNLKIVAGISTNETIAITYQFVTNLHPKALLSSEEAIKKRYDFQLIESNLTIKEKNIQQKKADYLPSIDLQAGYSYFSSADSWTMSENVNKYTYAGLTLNVPILSSGYRNTQVGKAKIEVDIAMNEKRDALQKMTMEINNLTFKISEESKVVDAAKTAMTTSEMAYKIMLENVNSGLVSQLDLRRMNTDFQRAKINYYNSIYVLECSTIDYKIATANY